MEEQGDSSRLSLLTEIHWTVREVLGYRSDYSPLLMFWKVPYSESCLL